MNTVGMCFIYCGVGLFGYQSYSAAAAFLVAGVGVIAAVHGSRSLADVHAAWGRRKWIVEQCRKVGYFEWSIPGILASFDGNGPASAST